MPAVAAAEPIARVMAGLSVERVADVVAAGHPSFIDRTPHGFHHLDHITATLDR
jgi:hypothetical protein